MLPTRLNRRRLLRGLGGAVVAAPFLSSVAERQARSEGVSAEPPRRLIVVFTHYGCLTTRWFPALSQGPLSAADYAATPTLAAMAPHADKLLMVRGIRSMNQWDVAGTLGQTKDPHLQACGSYFTCYPLSTDPSPFDPTPTGRSLDHVCAEQVNPGGAAPLVLRLGNATDTAMSEISYSDAGKPFAGVGSPATVFSSLTNLFGDGPVSPDTYRAARGKSVIDIIRDDLTRLQRHDMSQRDAQQLADWVELLHQTSGAVTNQCGAATATTLGLGAASVQAASDPAVASDLGQVTRVMLDLAALSALCDANRVIVIKYPPNYVFDFLGLTLDAHGISHRTGNGTFTGPCIDGAFDMIQKIDTWYAEQFAYLVGRLDGLGEGSGTLLDNTATVWFQELADGHAHNLNNLPILQAGACGGYFKTGWAVNVDGGAANLGAGNSEAECEDGMTTTDYTSLGTPSDRASRPINKYFCNLMNALGVKAGADGFASPGGTMPVTHFGKYDSSALFANPENPPELDDPGEYSELRGSG